MSGSWEAALWVMVVELVLKSVLLVSAVLTLLWFMRRVSAAKRHLWLAATAIMLLVLPPATLLLPTWSIDILEAPADAARRGAAVEAESFRPATAEFPEDGTGATGSPIAGEAFATPIWPRWLLLLWGTGAAILLAGLALGKLHGTWTAWQAVPVRDGPVVAALRDVAARLGLNRSIEARESERVKVPVVIGVLTPRLLLPPSTCRWPEARWRIILHHELAHVRRRDVLVQLLAQVACCLYWPNPLAWVLERRLFIERERACDDVALNAEIKASDYAGHLMEVLEEMGSMKHTTWIAAAMAEGTDFRDRILAVLNPVTPRNAPSRPQVLLVAALALVLVLPLSALNPWNSATAARMESSFDNGSTIFGGDASVSEPASGSGDNEARSAPATRPDRDRGRARDRDPNLRDTDSLAGRGTDIPFPVLLDMLGDPDPYLRKLAAFELGNRGDRRVVPALVTTLQDEDVFVREHVATALGKLGDKRAVPALIAALRDEDGVVREHAATALGNLDGESAVLALIAALRDEDGVVREHAAAALGNLGDRRAVPALRMLLEDRDSVVREHAAGALRKLGAGGRRDRDRD